MMYILKKIGSILILFGIVAGILYYLSGLRNGVDDSAVSLSEQQELKIKSEKIFLNTKRISALSLNTSFFSDSSFKSLIDTRVPLPDVATGRVNPFDPVSP
ncbi:MAG TPA: hypothetical protein VFV22_01030 [Candidatus Paceibacterota bacterium]|nr:hypothetical protein [Candidatus Paceibacterota bacterium]